MSNFKFGPEFLDTLLLNVFRGFNGFLNDLQLWDVNVLGHLVDCLNYDGRLCFNCVDDVLSMCVHNMLCLFFCPSNRHLNGLFSKRNSRVCNDLSHRTLLNPVLRESLGGLNQFLHSLRN